MDKIEKNRERVRKRYWKIKNNPVLFKKYMIGIKKNVKLWRERNPEKAKAHGKVFVAVRNGTLKRENCFCGNKKSQSHHENYDKPLKVIWFCKKHHTEYHQKKRNELSTIDNKIKGYKIDVWIKD